MKNIEVFSKSRKNVICESVEWAEEIGKDYTPDLVVFIAKSGFLFAKPIAEYFGCELIDVIAKRPGDENKNLIKKCIKRVPMGALKLIIRSRFMYSYNEKKTDRHVILGEKRTKFCHDEYHKILVVDDSVDTGWTLLETKGLLEREFKNSEIKFACYCVLETSKERISVDFYRYTNTIVLTATSRYSKEYEEFLSELREWEK